MRYFTSDLHLGHAGAKGGTEPGGILAYCPGRGHWKTVDEMNVGLIDNINDTCGKGDELWILGDIAMGQRAETLKHLDRLEVFTVLVAGNHDHIHPMHKQALRDKWRETYEAQVDAIIEPGITPIEGFGIVNLSHFPYSGDGSDHVGEERFTEWRPVDNGLPLLCGHVHDAWMTHGRMVNVGVDVWDHRPVSEFAIADLLNHRQEIGWI